MIFIEMPLTINQDANKYITALCRALGIKRFILTEAIDASEEGDKPAPGSLPIDSEKGIAMITDYSALLHQYLFGSTEIQNQSLSYLLITEAVLHSYRESNSVKELNLDSLKKIDITESLMSSAPPNVGKIFDTSLLSELKKQKLEKIEESSSAQAAKVLRLTGVSLLSLLNLGKMSPAQRRLFVGGRTNDELVDDIVNDIVAMKEKTLVAWSVDKHDKGLCDQVEQAVVRICQFALGSELAALKQEMKKFSDEDKKSYMALIKTRPEGNVIFRARQVMDRILLEADQSQRQDQPNEKALAS